jgi:hypothetical protein
MIGWYVLGWTFIAMLAILGVIEFLVVRQK